MLSCLILCAALDRNSSHDDIFSSALTLSVCCLSQLCRIEDKTAAPWTSGLFTTGATLRAGGPTAGSSALCVSQWMGFILLKDTRNRILSKHNQRYADTGFRLSIFKGKSQARHKFTEQLPVYQMFLDYVRKLSELARALLSAERLCEWHPPSYLDAPTCRKNLKHKLYFIVAVSLKNLQILHKEEELCHDRALTRTS